VCDGAGSSGRFWVLFIGLRAVCTAASQRRVTRGDATGTTLPISSRWALLGGSRDGAACAALQEMAWWPLTTQHPRGPPSLSHQEQIPHKNKHKNKYKRSMDLK